MALNHFSPSLGGVGPGSQEGAELDYLPMPSDMRTFHASLPEVEDPERIRPALTALKALAAAASRWTPEGGNLVVELPPLDDENRRVVADTLGEGEVSVRATGEPSCDVQESIFAGLWRVTTVGSGEADERIEIGRVPSAALKTPPKRIFCPPEPAAGVVNGPFIVTELVERCHAHRPGDEPYAINLSLLPHTPEDLHYLELALGQGEVSILSRGYGNCRIDSTALEHVWRVRYFNSQDALILDVIEVSDIPEVACAAPEDIADSVVRLEQTLEAMA
ncbi:hydrogenase expression/formation protein [Halomonas sp. DP5Y7-2]|uniref:hydrogenase expression/formation protein n=1 Tax=Halomonas sp. DP5Y7-2 TaxID=2859076 RepID=UPI001C995479|nr:hydrogenase expression/formation protein [Halomonas sp. DP5Y7-2]MBY5984740.1 hydrogenase expression/formation protein [Halomonas sp. DP5Y7-2]